MKRVLIIAYYWPPAGGPGVQRWLKFVKYFQEYGIEPVVYVPENSHYPLIDEALLDEIPEGIEIISYPIREPYRWAKLFSKGKTKQLSSGMISEKKSTLLERLLVYIRGNFFIPDARIGWVKPSVKFLRAHLEKHPVEAIVTTGPPHSLHLIGMGLKQQMGLPWLADFRDPWTTIHYHSKLSLSNSAQAKHKRLEKSVLESADHITVTSPGTQTEFKTLTEQPITVITNGFDTSDIPKNVPLDDVFSLVHIGSLLSKRNPEALWKILGSYVESSEEFAQHFRLRLIGAVSESVKKSIDSAGLSGHCELLGYIPHGDALREQQKAQVLLLIETDESETRSIIPGKLFEYMAAQRPILAIGPQGSDIAPILQESGSGTFHSYKEMEATGNLVKQLFDQYRSEGLSGTSAQIQSYSRKQLTGQMAEVLNDLI